MNILKTLKIIYRRHYEIRKKNIKNYIKTINYGIDYYQNVEKNKKLAKKC